MLGVELKAFLTARLDEDEAGATAARDVDGGYYGRTWIELGPAVVEHAHRHDPTRVLAEVAVKRMILAEWQRALNLALTFTEGRQAIGAQAPLGVAVQLLALAYAAHPDFNPS